MNDLEPKISVVMAVYNGDRFLKAAIDSVLSQSYRDFELIVIDDGSTDDSAKIIKGYADKRIRFTHQKNQGLASTLNNAIASAKGKYIARMDCDDISSKSRLEKQLDFLDEHPDIGLVGSSFKIIDEQGKKIGSSYHLDRPEDVKAEIFTRNPFGHGTIMGRREAIEQAGGYDPKQPIEDYDLWWRLMQKFDAANIPEELYSWRVVSSGMSHGSSDKRQQPIHKLLMQIWNQSNPPRLSFSQIKSGLAHYQQLGDGYLEQYRYMLGTLYLGSKRMGKRLYAAQLRAKLMAADPAISRVISDIQKNNLSHNYLYKHLHRN